MVKWQKESRSDTPHTMHNIWRSCDTFARTAVTRLFFRWHDRLRAKLSNHPKDTVRRDKSRDEPLVELVHNFQVHVVRRPHALVHKVQGGMGNELAQVPVVFLKEAKFHAPVYTPKRNVMPRTLPVRQSLLCSPVCWRGGTPSRRRGCQSAPRSRNSKILTSSMRAEPYVQHRLNLPARVFKKETGVRVMLTGRLVLALYWAFKRLH